MGSGLDLLVPAQSNGWNRKISVKKTVYFREPDSSFKIFKHKHTKTLIYLNKSNNRRVCRTQTEVFEKFIRTEDLRDEVSVLNKSERIRCAHVAGQPAMSLFINEIRKNFQVLKFITTVNDLRIKNAEGKPCCDLKFESRICPDIETDNTDTALKLENLSEVACSLCGEENRAKGSVSDAGPDLKKRKAN